MHAVQTTTATRSGAPMQPEAAQEFLVFRLGREEYATAIHAVQELRSYEAVTHLANAPAFLKGVVNLRGSIVPIVDLRIRFGVSEPTYDALTVVVVVNIGGRVVGMVVDGVSDVVALSAQQIRPTPAMSAAAVDTAYLTGIGTLDQRMLILVDIGRLLASAELGVLQRAA